MTQTLQPTRRIASNQSKNAHSPLSSRTKKKRQGKSTISELNSAGLYKEANKIANCSNNPTSSKCESGHIRIKTAYRCKSRFCLICSGINAERIRHETDEAVKALKQKYPGFISYFATFTIHSCLVEEVGDTLDRLIIAFNKLLRRRQVAKPLLGSFRGVHFNCDSDKRRVNIHIHALFFFKSTFQSRHYISEARWLELWRESYQDHSITQVKVKKVHAEKKGYPTQALSEGFITRYAGKPLDLEESFGKPLVKIQQGEKKQVNFWKVLHDSLKQRRLYCFTGEMRKARPQKQALTYSEKTCPHCASPLTDIIHQWDRQTETFIERKPLEMNKSDGSVLGKQPETEQIDFGYDVVNWLDGQKSGVRRVTISVQD